MKALKEKDTAIEAVAVWTAAKRLPSKHKKVSKKAITAAAAPTT